MRSSFDDKVVEVVVVFDVVDDVNTDVAVDNSWSHSRSRHYPSLSPSRVHDHSYRYDEYVGDEGV